MTVLNVQQILRTALGDANQPRPQLLGLTRVDQWQTEAVTSIPHQVEFLDGRWDGRTVREWLPEVISDVVEAARPLQIIVFGSLARGEEGPESGADLLVVLDHLDRSNRPEVMATIRSVAYTTSSPSNACSQRRAATVQQQRSRRTQPLDHRGPVPSRPRRCRDGAHHKPPRRGQPSAELRPNSNRGHQLDIC